MRALVALSEIVGPGGRVAFESDDRHGGGNSFTKPTAKFWGMEELGSCTGFCRRQALVAEWIREPFGTWRRGNASKAVRTACSRAAMAAAGTPMPAIAGNRSGYSAVSVQQILRADSCLYVPVRENDLLEE